MNIVKVLKDRLNKTLQGPNVLPTGMFELSEYFRHNGPINFDFHNEDGLIVAVSTNFNHGKIITQGKDRAELDNNIKDAILTSFEIPSAYAAQADIHRVDEQKMSYVLA